MSLKIQRFFNIPSSSREKVLSVCIPPPPIWNYVHIDFARTGLNCVADCVKKCARIFLFCGESFRKVSFRGRMFSADARIFSFRRECFRDVRESFLQSENFSAFFSHSSMSPAKSLVQISICFSFHIGKSKEFSLCFLCFSLWFSKSKA